MEYQNTSTAVKPLYFEFLPSYAFFILNNKLVDFCADQLRLMRQLDVPIFRYFAALPEEELLERSIEGVSKFLRSLADNKVEEYIAASLKAWMDDQLPSISRDKIVAEDITLISYMRRQMFRKYLALYTNDTGLFINILNEVDAFTTETDTRSFKILMSIHQELYRQTKEIAQLGNWVWDLKKDKITWSDEIFRMYGLKPQNEITYNLAAFNHPDDAAMINMQMRLSRETSQPHDFYYRIVLDGGAEKVLHAKGRVQVNESGEPYRMFGTVQDVTAQKSLEKEVLEKQFLIQKIADITPSMIAAYNINTGKYLFINRAIQTMLGYSQEEVLEKGVAFISSIIHPGDVQTLMEKNAEALAHANAVTTDSSQEPISEFLYRLKNKNGGYRWMQTYGTIFSRNKHKQVEEVINISVDVTDQIITANQLKAKHGELAEKNMELEHKNRELESFSYIASHDLQEPLRKVKFYTSQIKSKEDLPGEYYERIIKETTRMQQLINGLLEYSQMSGKEGIFEPVDLNEVAAEVKAELFELLTENQAIIDIANLPTVKGIRLQLYQLFVNLITNSVKYRRKDAAPYMQISAKVSESPDTLPLQGKMHQIAFVDKGIGFEDQYAQHIFELFRRLHSKAAYPGTGVGLTICKRIVENHKGLIKAEGKPGEGAAFYIYLPTDIQ